MKIFLKALKWIGLSIGSLLMFIILAGFVFRLLGPEPQKPMGKLVDVGDFKLHINAAGVKNNKPTVVIEAGSGMPSEYYHWLSEGLKDSLRVVRYDRAGIGYSESSNTSRNLETVARELHILLEKAGESPPYILSGHSFGGLYISVFAELYPDEVVAMVYLDPTHPEQVERLNAAPASSFRYKSAIWGLQTITVLGDMGILGVFDYAIGPVLAQEGLPNEINNRMQDFLMNGKCLRGLTRETKSYHSGLKRAGKISEFDSLPIRVFTAIEIDKEAYREIGIDPALQLSKRIEAQQEFANLSTNGKQFLIDANHSTIFTKKENAAIICNEIMQLLKE
jgi:pimeloyl-ACP methyl ester carboxylesterase